MTMSDRIAVMNKGRYEQLGDPRDLYERPTTRFVAGFLGVSNLLAGDVPRAPTAATRVVQARATARRVRVPAAADRGPRRRRGRRAAGEDPAAPPTTTRRPAGHNQLRGRRRRRLVPRRVAPSTSSRPAAAARSRSTSRTSSAPPGRAVGAGRGGPPDLVAGPHLRRRGRRRRRRRTSSRAATRRDRRRAPPSRRPRARPAAPFLIGGSLVALGGVAAFLAATRAAAAPTATPVGNASPSAHRRRRRRRERGPPPAGPRAQVPTGPLNFANWDAYIDLTTVPGPDGELGTDDDEYDLPSPTLDEFSRQVRRRDQLRERRSTRTSRSWGRSRPQLTAGLDTGWDLIVLTDWMASRVVAAGWAEKIDHANTPTAVANVRDELKGQPWDPNFDYHFPWQSFATGVGYNVASTAARPHQASPTCSTRRSPARSPSCPTRTTRSRSST